MKNGDADYTEEEIARRRDEAIGRALDTPPKPLKEIAGKNERAQGQHKSRVRKAARSKTKSPDFGVTSLNLLAIYEVVDM